MCIRDRITGWPGKPLNAFGSVWQKYEKDDLFLREYGILLGEKKIPKRGVEIMDMNIRPRRLRNGVNLRKMVRETRMDKSSLIYPMFMP